MRLLTRYSPILHDENDTTETGSTSESIVDSEGFSWTDFYREQFRDSISDDAIKKFAAEYKNSEEEEGRCDSSRTRHLGRGTWISCTKR